MRTRCRHYLSVCALAGALAAGVATPAGATGTTGAQRQHLCGHVLGSVAVTELRTGCATARRVAIAYINTGRGVAGFHCRRHAIQAAAGYYAVCTASRHRIVQVTPE